MLQGTAVRSTWPINFFNDLSLRDRSEFLREFQRAPEVRILSVSIECKQLAAIWAVQLNAVTNLVGLFPEDLLTGRAPNVDFAIHGVLPLRPEAPSPGKTAGLWSKNPQVFHLRVISS